jgi:hypothetical protein
MKFVIYDWAGGCREKIKKAGYDLKDHCPDVEMSGDIFETAKKIYDTGLNVMLWHGRNEVGTMPVLFVDTGKFGQR